MGSRLLGQWFHIVMGFVVIVATPFLAIFELFLPHKNRGRAWRVVGAFACRAAFAFSSIRIRVMGRESVNPLAPAIYAANHGCTLDGFILSSILGRRALLFTAPLSVFPKPIAYWMRKMEAIDVRRDKIDDAKYPKGESIREALLSAKKELKAGNSLIIFPEGHIQYLDVMHYFHTGSNRLSATARVPIVPVAMINTPECIPNRYNINPGTITVRFDRPIPPPADTHPRTIRAARDTLEKRIVAMLPPRYVPPYYFDNNPHKVGVFVDIDDTMYEGITLVDLLRYLLELHRIHNADIVRSGYLLFLERMHQIPHKEFMKREMLMLRGWDADSLHTLVARLFKRRMLKKFNYYLFTLLKDHAEARHAIVFVTETIHPIAREFKNFLKARTVIDTKLETEVRHNHKTYTGRIKCLCYKEKKAELVSRFAADAGIDLSKSYGYGDSINDAPFLKLLGHPVVVHPDHALRALAERERWAILGKE